MPTEIAPGIPTPRNDRNKVRAEDRSVHEWYRFVLSFPPHLVTDYLKRFDIGPSHTVLDPFCGTGTTLVECKKRGIGSVGMKLAYVVGDQASYLRVMIRSGQLLADIARSLGYVVTDIDLFRTRPSTVTGEHLREEVVLLEWPGD